jgi:uncharacterized repeat protein (TIGR03806 family)
MLMAAALLAASCSTSPPPCTPVSGQVVPFPTLADWCQVSLVNGDISPAAGVTPYGLNTPLFSDYAVKRRTVWMPSGTSATYDENFIFAFPEGTVFTKSFGFADDLRSAQPNVTWIETRVIWKTGGLWNAVSYTWDAAQTTATVAPGGEVVPISWIDASGNSVSTDYLVPSAPQCAQCHDQEKLVTPIGPTARNLNRDYDYGTGSQNQLTQWSTTGILTGAPSPAVAPKLPVAFDPATGSLNDRARAYLEVNCAHCHSPGGEARTTGLYLSTKITDPIVYGVCKKPIAAGDGAGGRIYDIIPGDPDGSIIPYRMASTEPHVAMPQIGRSVVDVPGLQLVRDWISSLPGSCP